MHVLNGFWQQWWGKVRLREGIRQIIKCNVVLLVVTVNSCLEEVAIYEPDVWKDDSE